MEDNQIKKIEQRAYARGYRAGMRRRQNEIDQLQKELEGDQKMRRERIFCAVMNGLLASGNTANWCLNGKRIHNSKTYTDLAKRFVNEAIRQMEV